MVFEGGGSRLLDYFLHCRSDVRGRGVCHNEVNFFRNGLDKPPWVDRAAFQEVKEEGKRWGWGQTVFDQIKRREIFFIIWNHKDCLLLLMHSDGV